MATPREEPEALNPFLRAPEVPTQGVAPVPETNPFLPTPVDTEVSPFSNEPVVQASAAPVNPDSASSIIGRSVDQMQASLGSALETAGELTGSEFLVDAGASYRQEQLDEAAQYGNPTISSYKQVDWEDPEQISMYLKQMGLSGVPSLGVGVAGAVGGARVGAIGGARGAVAGGILGALATALPMNIGEVQGAMKEIDPEGKSPWTAVLGGAAMSSLDLIGLTSIAKPLIKTFGKDIAYKALQEQGVAKELALGAVKGALVEAPTEALQEGVKAVAAAQGTDTNINTEQLIEDMINSAVSGGLAGGAMGGPTSAYAANRSNQMVEGGAAPGATFTEGRTEPLNMVQRAFDGLGSEATALLEPLARVSPSFEKIIRKFRPDMTGETASAPTIFEDADLMVGKWTSHIQEGLRGKDIDQALSDYVNGVQSPEAKFLRDSIQDVEDVAKSEGKMDVGHIENYLPTHLDVERIKADPMGFIQAISPYEQDPQGKLASWIEEVSQDRSNVVPKVDRSLEQDANGNWTTISRHQRGGDPESFRSKFTQGTVPPKFGNLERSRAFGNTPQKVLLNWSKEQSTPAIMDSLRDYFEGSAHRIAFAKAFGPSGEKLNFELVKGVNEAQSKGRNPTSQEVDHLYNLLDAYNGQFGRIKTQGLRDTVSVASGVATAAALPLTVLSSLVEVAAPAIRGDIKSALIEIAPTIAQVIKDSVRGIFTRIPRNEFSRFAAESNITLTASLNIASERLGTSIFNRGTATGLKYYFLGNGLTLLTHTEGTYAARVGDRIFHDNLRLLSGGLPVSSAKGARAANQLRSMGVPVYTNADAKALYDPQTFSQRQTADQYRRLAMRRFKDQTILEPNIADTPLWMSNGHLGVLALLNRYPSAFGNIILPALVRKMRPTWAGSRSNAMGGAVGATFLLAFMLSVGYLQDEMKQIMKNGEVDYDDTRTDGQRLVDVINTTITPLQVSKLTDFIAAPRYGQSGSDTVLGPVVGIGADTGELAFKTIANFAEGNSNEGEIWKWMYRLTPAQFYRPGREAASEFELFD